MKKFLIASVFSAALTPAVAMADNSNFTGFSVGLNLNFVEGGLKYSEVENGQLTSTDSMGGKEATVASIEGTYGFTLSPTAVVLIGIEADLSDAKLHESAYFDVIPQTLNIKQKNRYGVSIAPGMVLSKETLLYGKLIYNSMKGEVSGIGERNGAANPFSISKTFKGVGYGAGIKTMISKTTFVKAEVVRTNYSGENIDGGDWKPRSTYGTLGIGMNF